MAGINTLNMFTTISNKFDGSNFVEQTRYFNDILQITWPFLRKVVSELERPEPNREKMEKWRKVLGIAITTILILVESSWVA